MTNKEILDAYLAQFAKGEPDFLTYCEKVLKLTRKEIDSVLDTAEELGYI